MNNAIIGSGFHASRESARVQAKVFGESFESFHTSAALALVNVQVVLVGPECALFSRTLGGVGRQVGIVIDMGKMQIGIVYEAGINVDFLDFQGRTTGPMLATGSEEVAEIGDGHGGIRRAEDIPVPGRGKCRRGGIDGRGISGRSVGGG